jgi:hypothetical protein
MSLYFSVAVWASLALCIFYALEDHIPRYRTAKSDAVAVVSKEHPVMARDLFTREAPRLSRFAN